MAQEVKTNDDRQREAALALHRFGLGPKRNSIAEIASDPRGALLAEIERPGVGRINNPDLLSATAAARSAFEARSERRAQTIMAQRAQKESERVAAQSGVQAPGMSDELASKAAAAKAADAALADQGVTERERQNFLKEVKARLDAAFDADIGFAERLVWFWSNHFCVSTFTVYNMAAGYEREAIRPHVLGRFADMLLATEGHPAMLIYLDSTSNRRIHPNENYARELMELFCLGVGNYTERDIKEVARAFTMAWGTAAARTWNRHRSAVRSFSTWAALDDLAAALDRRVETPLAPAALDLDALWTRDLPLREHALWRMLHESAAGAKTVLALNIEDLDLDDRRGRAGDRWVSWRAQTARLLPALLAGRARGPVFLGDRRPGPARLPGDADLCPDTGRRRLSYERAEYLFKRATGHTLRQLKP